MAFKMNARSPLMKTLVGGQKNLPEGLKGAIEAAPGKMMDSPAKNMNKGYGTPSPAKAKTGPGVPNEAGKTGTGGANSANGVNAKKPTTPSLQQDVNGRYGGPTTPKKPAAKKPAAKKPAYDKELNSLVASRKGLKKGTAEYNKVQNRINEKLGSSVRRKVEPAKPAPKKETLISKESRNPVGELNLAPAPKTPKLTKSTASKPKPKANTLKVRQTAAGTTLVKKDGGGANKGGTTRKEKVTKNSKKVITKTAGTRTVEKTNKDGSSSTKTTKRLGKGRIKEALANRKEAKQNKKALKQTKKANVSVDGAPTKPRNNSMVSAK